MNRGSSACDSSLETPSYRRAFASSPTDSNNSPGMCRQSRLKRSIPPVADPFGRLSQLQSLRVKIKRGDPKTAPLDGLSLPAQGYWLITLLAASGMFINMLTGSGLRARRRGARRAGRLRGSTEGAGSSVVMTEGVAPPPHLFAASMAEAVAPSGSIQNSTLRLRFGSPDSCGHVSPKLRTVMRAASIPFSPVR